MRRHRGEVTVSQVAAAAGVSTATVSRVISGGNRVSADAEQRVRDAIRELGYVPNRLAQGLRRRRTRNLGLVLPGFTNTFFFELIAQMVEIGREAGYAVLVAGADDPAAEASRLAREGLVDGLVLVADRSGGDAADLGTLGLPIVCFDRAPRGLHAPVIGVDNERGAYEITRHLLDAGARCIAHLAGPDEVAAGRLRRLGYERALADAGLGLDQRLVVTGDFGEASGAVGMATLLRQAAPDAVFAANDLMAIGAMSALGDAGLAVPGDVLVAGFDGIAPGRFTVPQLTTYVQPVSAMARDCVRRLLDLIDDPAGGDAAAHVVPGTLLARGSTDAQRESEGS